MRKATVSFVAGEPLPAAKVDALVGSTAEVSEAATREHSPEGIHSHMRFEFAMGVLALSGGAWKLEFGDRISVFANYPSGHVEIAIDHSDAPVISASSTVGLIAYTEDGVEVPYSGFVHEKDINCVLYPPSGADMIFVIAIGRRKGEG